MEKFEPGNLLKREVFYSGEIVELIVDRVQVKGRETVREVVRHPGGVVILAEVEQDRIPFVRQHRYPIGKPLLELPAGKLDEQGDPAREAARELEEETGYKARTLQQICRFYSSPGFCNELLHFYYTADVEKTKVSHEDGEDIQIEFYTLKEAVQMIFSGQILDGKTIIALLWLERQKSKKMPV